MKTTFLMLSVVLASFTGCSNWSGKPNPHIVGPEGDKNLILKSGVFKSCMHFDNAKAGAEIAPIAAAFALSAIEKVSTLAVDKMVGALSEVAKNRNDAFPVDGKSVANMYRNEPAGVALQRCLVVVAGVQDSTSQLCENKDSDWYKQLTNMDACRNDEPVIESINGWGISKPAFYAEIVLYSPNDESPSYVVPKLVYLYYPEPLSSHAAKDLKSTIFTVSAAAPSNLTTPVFSFVYDAGQVSPSKSIKLAGTPEALKFADDPGVWTVVPSTLSALGNGAVNLTASLIETPEPNLLITQAEELLKEQEPMLKTELNSKVQYAFLSDTRMTSGKLSWPRLKLMTMRHLLHASSLERKSRRRKVLPASLQAGSQRWLTNQLVWSTEVPDGWLHLLGGRAVSSVMHCVLSMIIRS